MRLVLAFEVAEEGEPRVGMRRHAMLREDFSFAGGEEPLGHRVVVGIAFMSSAPSTTVVYRGSRMDRPTIRGLNTARATAREKPRGRQHVRNVGDSQRIRRTCAELAFIKIGRRVGSGTTGHQAFLPSHKDGGSNKVGPV
jgi:hypothetical protein